MSLSLAVMIKVAMKGGPIGTAIGTGKQPRLPAESKAPERPFGGTVGQAHPTVAEGRSV
jgi:hypothetical protein